ncbi:hypothetical protein WN55_05449 [Dufourea novaeangliae]|uniref:Uncharacterized protein n=1 Tax=Dufourea novaeangliae TaxID=178035 RepID=A0A154P0G9_DUFNO|nr:hypothetical protein WN55_05449 [Dufourea novaeangliae]
MIEEMKGTNVYGAGGFGSPSTGAEGGGRPGPLAASSIDRENAAVDRQAAVFSITIGEEASGAGTSPAPASGVWSGVPDAAPGPSGSTGVPRELLPIVRLRRHPSGLSRWPSTASVDACVTLSDDESDSSSTVSAASVRSDVVGPGAVAGRKRGRSPTAGEYVGLAEAKKRLLELTLQERQLEEEAAVVAAEMRHAPTADLGAVILEKVAIIQKVDGTSHNRKGTFVRSLREAALHIKHAAAEQAKRTVGSEREAELERELRELPARLSATEALSRVRDDGAVGDAMGAAAPDASIMPPPNPPVPASAYARRYGRVVAADLAPPSPPRVEHEVPPCAPGGVGSPSTDAEGSSRPSSPASLSDDRVDAVVDHQATAVGLATGEEVSGAGTMSAPASISGRRGRGVRAAASGAPRSGGSRAPQPSVRLQRQRVGRLGGVDVHGVGGVGLFRRRRPGRSDRGDDGEPNALASPMAALVPRTRAVRLPASGARRALASRGSSLLRGFCNSGRPLRPPFNAQLRTGTD